MEKIKQKTVIVKQVAKGTAKKQAKGFFEFIREQGVITLAIGFILGGAITKLVQSFVNDIINPIIGLMLGKGTLANASVQIGSAKISYGLFISALIDFAIIALVVYLGVKVLGLEKLDKEKPKKEKTPAAKAAERELKAALKQKK